MKSRRQKDGRELQLLQFKEGTEKTQSLLCIDAKAKVPVINAKNIGTDHYLWVLNVNVSTAGIAPSISDDPKRRSDPL